MDTPASLRRNRFRLMAMGYTTWRATFGNGAEIGIALIITRYSPTKAESRAIHKGRIRHSIQLSLTRRSASIGAARFFATSNIARGTLSVHVAKVRLILAQITSVSVV